VFDSRCCGFWARTIETSFCQTRAMKLMKWKQRWWWKWRKRKLETCIAWLYLGNCDASEILRIYLNWKWKKEGRKRFTAMVLFWFVS